MLGDILAVHGVHEVAEHGLHALYDRGHHLLGLLRGPGLGRDAHEAFAALGVGREGGVRELLHIAAQAVLHLALAYAVEVDVVRGDDSVGELREDGPHAVLEQGPDLPRRPGAA